MRIAGMAKTSLIDYPGLVSCVLFMPGCNFDCFYCHNRTLVDGPFEVLEPELVEAFLRKRTGQLDGVVMTGGEPTLQPDLLPYLAWVRSFGYKIKLDTNGSSPRMVESLLHAGVCDFWAVDWKAPVSRYAEIGGPGANPAHVLETIRLLLSAGADSEVRTTVVPQLCLEGLLIRAKELPVLPRYVLNRYRPPEVFKPRDAERVWVQPYNQFEIDAFADAVRFVQPNTVR